MLKFIFIAFWLALHPVHVTLLSIGYSPEKNAFDAFLRVYYDDFQVDYERLTGEPALFDFERRKPEAVKGISAYLKEKVQIYSGEKILSFKIVSLALSSNELNINIVYNYSGKPETFKVKNSILTDLYNDQSNLLIFRYGDYEEGVKLTPEKREHIFDIKKGS